MAENGQKAQNLDELYRLNEDWAMQQSLLRDYLGFVFDALNPRFLGVNAEVLLLGDTEMMMSWHRAQMDLVRRLQEKWEDLKEGAGFEKLWVENQDAYFTKLAECQAELLAYTHSEWQAVLRGYQVSLSEFAQREEKEHARVEQQISVSQGKLSGKRDAEEEIKQLAQREEKLKADRKASTQQIAKVQAKVEAVAISLDDLREAIPKEELPCLDLPEVGDEESDAKQALFVNTAKACYDVMATRDQKEISPQLAELKQQAITAELKSIAEHTGITLATDTSVKDQVGQLAQALLPALQVGESKEGLPVVGLETKNTAAQVQAALAAPAGAQASAPAISKALAEREYQRLSAIVTWSQDQTLSDACPAYLTPAQAKATKLQKTLVTLMKTGFLDEVIPGPEQEAAVRKALPDVEITGFTMGAQKRFKRSDIMQQQQSNQYPAYASDLTPLEITYTQDGEAVTVQAYLDRVNHNIYFRPSDELLIEFDPNLHIPAPPSPRVPARQAASTVAVSTDAGTGPKSKSEDDLLKKPSKAGFINWRWLLFGLLCAASGIAFALSGFAFSIGAPFVATVGVDLAVGVSAQALIASATLANPTFWALAGIGLAYGLATLLVVYALFKIGEALVSWGSGKPPKPQPDLPGSPEAKVAAGSIPAPTSTLMPPASPPSSDTAQPGNTPEVR